MLKKSRRLSTEEVAHVQSRGKRASFGRLRLSWCKRSANAEVSRFAVVVSKKVAGTAVGRNTLRRRAYTHLSGIKLPSPIDAVMFVQFPYATSAALGEDIDGLIAPVTAASSRVQ